MKREAMYGLVLGVIVFVLLAAVARAEVIEDQVLAPSVTVTSGQGSGSGVVFLHEAQAYILTAGHVVGSLLTVEPYLEDGVQKQRERWADANVVQMIVQDGRSVGKIEMQAEVVAFDEREDLALLRVRRQGYFSLGAVFVGKGEPLGPGVNVLHCGSRRGELGANSLTGGIVSYVGRVYENQTFDQTDAAISPGSSGGGIFTREGRYAGMVTMAASETFVLYVPIRRIAQFLVHKSYGWICPDWNQRPKAVPEIGPKPVDSPPHDAPASSDSDKAVGP